MQRARLIIVCALTLCAFASNSLLTRRALGAGQAGAASFAALRLLSGAAMMWILSRNRQRAGAEAGWRSALWLFLYAAPPAAARSGTGAALAVASGALASGLGYSLWNTAMPHLRLSTAAILQISVPPLAAAGGIALLGERPTARLVLGGGAILAGVA